MPGEPTLGAESIKLWPLRSIVVFDFSATAIPALPVSSTNVTTPPLAAAAIASVNVGYDLPSTVASVTCGTTFFFLC